MKKLILALSSVLFCLGLYGCSSCSSQKDANLYDVPRQEGTHQKTSYSKPNDSKPQTSSGYTSDPDYKPTVDSRGEYRTIDGNAKQVQYQGSKEQQRDLDAIDEYMKNNPNF